MKLLMALLVAFYSIAASAALTVEPCDSWEKSMEFIVSPWKENNKTLYNGRVRVVHIDTFGEPVCCSAKLLVFMPDRDAELSGQKCLAVENDGSGFQSVDFKNHKISYNPNRGVKFSFDYELYIDGISSDKRSGSFYINLKDETININ